MLVFVVSLSFQHFKKEKRRRGCCSRGTLVFMSLQGFQESLSIKRVIGQMQNHLFMINSNFVRKKNSWMIPLSTTRHATAAWLDLKPYLTFCPFYLWHYKMWNVFLSGKDSNNERKDPIKNSSFQNGSLFGSLASHHLQVCTLPPPNHHQQLCLPHLCQIFHMLDLTDQEDLFHNEAVQLLFEMMLRRVREGDVS